MKTLKTFLFLPAFLLLPPLATASVYTGSWENKTFGSSGDLTIDFEIKKGSVAGSFDFDGPVFGAGDPPAIKFKAPLKSDGSGSFKVTGTQVGDLAGSFTSKGKLTITITNIPGGLLTKAEINGKFDLKLEKFDATYEIDSTGGPFANGVAEAHVPKPAVIKMAKKVTVTGKTAKTPVKVETNTTLKSITADAKGKATVKLKGTKSPYQLVASNLTAPTVKVTVKVENADGFTSKKTVKFVKAASASAAD